MLYRNRCAKVNVKLLIVLLLVVVAVGMSLVAARQVRRTILSERSLTAGNAAFEKQDWRTAYKNFQEYLGRNPDDVEILRKYAKARLSVRPLEPPNVMQAIAAYRRIVQLEPLDEDVYDELARLYRGIGNFEELAYIARARLKHAPNDRQAPLWLAEALIRLDKLEEAKQTLLPFIEQLEGLAGKHTEYVQACVLMSSVTGSDDSFEVRLQVLEWLNKALEYSPESAEALAYRARLYRVTPNISGLTDEERMAVARQDLQAADDLGTEDPRIRYVLGTEWMAHGELDRAAAELQAVDELPQEKLQEHFLDIKDWTVARFLLASELVTQRGTTAEGAALADEAMAALTERRHRTQVLPIAIPLYVAAGQVAEARRYLDEYLDMLAMQQGAPESRLRPAYLQALVARAEEKPYAVIDALQPLLTEGSGGPALWRLLAEAYSRTGQAGRAVSALEECLRHQPQDPWVTLQLAREYSRLGDWTKAFETAQRAESLNPTDVGAKLLRIGASIYLAAEDNQSVDTEKLEELSAELTELCRQYPDRGDIRRLQASIATYLDQPDETEKELKLAIEQSEEPLAAKMQLAGYYRQTGRTAEAVKVCEAACEHHAEVAEPWLSLSGLHQANADYDSARSCLKEGLNAVVDKEEKRSLSIRLAFLEIINGDRSTGINLLKELTNEDKQEIRARSLLLALPEIQSDAATAQKLIDELRQVEGESGLWWRFHQASLWLSSDEWRSKQQDIADLLQYCIDADPRWSPPVLLLVGMYERLEDFSRVEDICRQTLARYPSATAIADTLLRLLERQGRFSEAERVLQQIDVNPRLASAWQVRTALGAGDLSRAIDELQLRVSNDDQDASARIQLARLIYEQTKDAERAFQYLKEAEAIASGSRMLTAVEASILRAEGRTEDARQVLDNYVADNNDFNAYWMRAVFLAEQGELDHAEKDYKKLTTFSEQGAAGFLLLGNFYAGNQELDKAVATLEEGSNAYPDDLVLKRRLMQLLLARADAQDRERALEILATLEERLPHDPELVKIRALQMLEKPTPESVEVAKERLEDVIRLEPTAVDVHLMLIGIAMQERKYETARDNAIRALGSNPSNSALLSARGRTELLLKNTQMAVELARLALQEDPNNVEALGVLADAGMVREDRSLLDEARTLLESAVGRDPTNERLLVSRARFLASLDSPQKAIPELESYCQTEEGSSSVAALVTLSDLYRLAGDMEQSKQRIERAERLDPNSQTVVHARFLWLLSQDRAEELEDISSAYISAKQQNLTTVLRAASVLAASDSMKLKKQGLKLFEHGLTLSPTSMDARLGLASTLYETGDVEGAKKVYEKLLQQYPDNVQVLNDLAWILQEHDHRYADALELADRGLRLAPEDVHLLDTRGVILSNMSGRLADAKKDFERLLQLASPDTRRQAKTLLHLGRVCAKLNDLTQAREHLENALEIDQKIDVFTTDERSEITQILQRSGVSAALKP